MLALFLALFLSGLIALSSLAFIIFAIDAVVWKHNNLTSSHQAINEIVKIVKEFKPGAKTFYDLGCSRGRLAISLKCQLPKLQVFAIDKNLVRICFAKARAFFWRQKINFRLADIFEIDLSQADIVYIYLLPDIFPALEEKLSRELKPNSLVIVNTEKLPSWQPVKTRVVHPKAPNFEKLSAYRR